MKVRWNESSFRLRITPTELAMLLRDDSVTETLTLPGGGVWSATIQPSGATPSRLDSAGGVVQFSLSDADRDRLAAPDSEGVYFTPEDLRTEGIRAIIEKDYPCAHPRAIEANEPTTEAFAPPPGFEERKLAP